MCSKQPAIVLGETQKGTIEKGFNADIILFDPEASYEVLDKHSLYYKDTLYGKVSYVIVEGKVVFNQ